MPDIPEPTATLEQQAPPSRTGEATLLDDGETQIPQDQDAAAGRDAQSQPEDKVQPAAPDTAAKTRTDAPPPGYVRETDLNALRSAYDRRLNETITRAEQVERRLAEFENTGAVRARTDAARQELHGWLQAQGIDPAQHTQRLEQIAQAFGQAEQNQRRVAELEQYTGALTQANYNTIMMSWVNELAHQYKLESDDIRTLKSLYRQDALTNGDALITTGRELNGMARQLGSIRAAAQAATRAKQAEVKPQTFDAATGAGGMSDDQFLKAYSEGQTNDHARALAIQTRRGVF